MALGVLVALAAVSLPWMWSQLAARDLPESAESITGILLLARAEAMASGKLVEVRAWRADASPVLELRAAYLDPQRLSSASFSGDDGDDSPLDDFDQLDEGPDDLEAVLAASWARRRLPAGISLRQVEPAARDEFGSTPLEGELEAFADLDSLEDPTTLLGPIDRPIAIYLPDGSNILAAAWWLEEVPTDGVLPPLAEDDRRRLQLSLFDPLGIPRWGAIEWIVPREPVIREADRETESPSESRRDDAAIEIPESATEIGASAESDSGVDQASDPERDPDLDPETDPDEDEEPLR